MSTPNGGTFGVVCAGRMVRTDFEQLDATHAALSLLDADSINHICVFMTGAQPFPEHLGGSVYICWVEPNGSSEQHWHYLGYICNQKPSAVFRVSKLRNLESSHIFTGASMYQRVTHHTAVAHLGIVVENLNEIAAKTPAAGTDPNMQENTFLSFGEKMAENFVNHVQSFATKLADPLTGHPTDYIPAVAVHSWYEAFTRKMKLNPQFWKQLTSG